MINGAHVLLFSKDADADRAFLRDVLQFRAVDAGHGWLIFALPPSEVAVHPIDGREAGAVPELPASLYLMCDDIRAFITSMEAKEGGLFIDCHRALGTPDEHEVAEWRRTRRLPADPPDGDRIERRGSGGYGDNGIITTE